MLHTSFKTKKTENRRAGKKRKRCWPMQWHSSQWKNAIQPWTICMGFVPNTVFVPRLPSLLPAAPTPKSSEPWWTTWRPIPIEPINWPRKRKASSNYQCRSRIASSKHTFWSLPIQGNQKMRPRRCFPTSNKSWKCLGKKRCAGPSP